MLHLHRPIIDLTLKYQLFLDATVELSLDSTQNNQKKVPAKMLVPVPPQEATSSSKSQLSYEEVRICLFVFEFLGLCAASLKFN
jgi:hypothetical protein